MPQFIRRSVSGFTRTNRIAILLLVLACLRTIGGTQTPRADPDLEAALRLLERRQDDARDKSLFGRARGPDATDATAPAKTASIFINWHARTTTAWKLMRRIVTTKSAERALEEAIANVAAVAQAQ